VAKKMRKKPAIVDAGQGGKNKKGRELRRPGEKEGEERSEHGSDGSSTEGQDKEWAGLYIFSVSSSRTTMTEKRNMYQIHERRENLKFR
jgi:hypothetical protein